MSPVACQGRELPGAINKTEDTHLRRYVLHCLVLQLRVFLHRVRDLRVLNLISLLQRPSGHALEGLPGCQLDVLELVDPHTDHSHDRHVLREFVEDHAYDTEATQSHELAQGGRILGCLKRVN